MNNNDVKPSDILVRAQELLGNKGQRWIKHHAYRKREKRFLGFLTGGYEDTYCSLGAIYQATRELDPIYCVYRDARMLLSHEMDGSIAGYNDGIFRSFLSIKKAFCAATKAALEVEARELDND